MNVKRIKQVWHYGWIHAGQIVKREGKGLMFRMKVFVDILYCYRVYRMWSNQYLKEKFYSLSKEERKCKGEVYRVEGIKRDKWQADFVSNRRFLYKYAHKKYERPSLRAKRNKAYTKRYHMGKNCFVEYDVEFSRQHYLDGTISIGNNVLFAKHVFIDYSGEVVIEDGVKIANGVIIESHHRDIDAYNQGKDINVPTKLLIKGNAYIGSRAIILDSCNYIGLHARIGAGAVVTKDVPDYAVVVGVPAKVIKYLNQ